MILAKSMIKFHEMVLINTQVEILFDTSIMTISSIALKIFFEITNLKEKLGIEPITGYNGDKTNKIQSKIAINWSNEIKNQSQHPDNFRWIFHKLGEKRIGHFYVDGYDELTDTIYEFMGCFYHGCLDCFDPNKFNKIFGKLNMETENRLSYLRQ